MCQVPDFVSSFHWTGLASGLKSKMEIELLKSIGLSEAKAKETMKNANLTKNLVVVVNHASKVGDVSVRGNLLYNLASKIKPQIVAHLPMLSEYVVTGKLDTEVRVQAALEYLMQNPDPTKFDSKAFESSLWCWYRCHS